MKADRTTHKQLIDEHRDFKYTHSYLSRSSIESAASVIGPVGRNYYSAAIIGVQNSGKSTLLNFLFGTNFDVLHDIAGTRTTRGIWVSVDKQ